MTAKRLPRGIALFGLCVLAVLANRALMETVLALKLPLFLDTVFTCALSFAGGPVPGIVVVALTLIDIAFFRALRSWPFLLCSLAEVLLICLLRPGRPRGPLSPARGPGPEKTASFVNTFTVLLILYVTACIAVSVLGGIVDYVLYSVLGENKNYYSPDDTFKIGLLRSDPPIVLVNILSRIPVNIVDRFVVMFGGFALSLPLRKIRWLWKGDAAA